MSTADAKRLKCGRPSPQGTKAAAQSSSSQGASEWKQKLQKFLEGEGLRSSEQRWKIAELILSEGEHLSAQEVVSRVRRRHPEIGAATVYRNIKVLCDAHILKESLSDAEGRTVYERFDEGHHDHIVCLDCGEIFEFHEEAIEELQDSVTQKLGFNATSHRHVIYAHCEWAAKAAKRRK